MPDSGLTTGRQGAASIPKFREHPPAGAPAATDHALLVLFSSHHDQHAFEELVRRHHVFVTSLCRHILRSHADVEDAAQAVFIELARKASSLDGRSDLLPWLYVVTRRAAHALARRTKTRSAHERSFQGLPAASAHVPESGGAGNVDPQREALESAIAALPMSLRSPVIHHYLLGMSHEQTARLMGIPVGTVSRRLHQARHRLRNQLNRLGAGGVPAAIPLLAITHTSTAPVPSSLSGLKVLTVAGRPVVGGASVRACEIAASLSSTVMGGWIACSIGFVAAVIVIIAITGRADVHIRHPSEAATIASLPPHQAFRRFHVGGLHGLARFADLPPLLPGDHIDVEAGVYNEAHTWKESGSEDEPIVIEGPAVGQAIIAGDGLELDGQFPHPRALFQFQGGNYRVEGIEMRNARNGSDAAGIYLLLAGKVAFRHCRVSSCDAGIASTGGEGIDASECDFIANGIPSGNSHNVVVMESHHCFLDHCAITDSFGKNIWSSALHNRITACRIASSRGGEIDVTSSKGRPADMLIGGTSVVAGGQREVNAKLFISASGPIRLALIGDSFVALPQNLLIDATDDAQVIAVNTIFLGSDRICESRASWSGGWDWFPPGDPIPSGLLHCITGTQDPISRIDLQPPPESPCLDAGTNPQPWLAAKPGVPIPDRQGVATGSPAGTGGWNIGARPWAVPDGWNTR